MNVTDVLHQRLLNQQIAATAFTKPEELVHWMGGMQAQDYGQAMLAIGTRLPGIKNEAVEKAIIHRKIIRTWLFRGTLHFVSASNIHRYLDLLSPKLVKANASNYKRLELDTDILARCKKVLARSLKDGKELTREEIRAALAQKGIVAPGLRLLHILHRASLEKIICLGTKKGSQFTYTLLDDAVPAGKPFDREETLAALTLQYFKSHGPATVQDFVWWSGLNMTDAKSGLQLIKEHLIEENIAGQAFLSVENNWKNRKKPGTIYLLPGFDEYILGYKERSQFLAAPDFKKVVTTNGLFAPTIIIDGKVAGTWKRIVKKNDLLIEITPFKTFSRAENKVIEQEVNRYADFMGLNSVISTKKLYPNALVIT